uniref:Ig-like domain-containing protein n=1 Tax=Cacopsylla melanoneura TaxID=428564 RepID=A0A8D8SXD0_9HEMI
MHTFGIIFGFVLLPFVCFRVLDCLKDVYLEIIPPAVQKGHNVTLFCHYDMEGAPLYSVKWYRGKHEYYRYTPSDSPQSKVFPLHGISVDVSTFSTLLFLTWFYSWS